LVNCRCTRRKWLKTSKWQENRRVWKCFFCGHEQAEDEPFHRQALRVLYVDIETSLTELYNFGLRVPGEYVNYKLLKKPMFIICWAAKIVGENKVHSACVTPEEARAGNDKNIMAPLWDLMDSADVIAGHNSDKFDLPRITGRMLANGFSKLEPYKTYDTKKMAKKHKFESNSLEALCRLFGLPMKDKMELEDWIKIQETGDEKTLRKMHKYCRGDVRNGVDILNILLSWDTRSNYFAAKSFPKTQEEATVTELASRVEELEAEKG
jgi:DNA polymerase elongation subunit (family B)